jgi:hypothetical protein
MSLLEYKGVGRSNRSEGIAFLENQIPFGFSERSLSYAEADLSEYAAQWHLYESL